MLDGRTLIYRRAQRQAGFTLLELLIVLAILGLLATLVGPQLIGLFERSKVKTAEIQLSQIAVALDLYRLEIGAYPTTQEGLTALLDAPPNARNWHGPYLARRDGLVDPWGNPYNYRSPGAAHAFDLYSFGADGQEGGEDDKADVAFRQ